MNLELSGIHHLTAITAKVGENRRFYTGTLGLRLVKKSVNQDDTSAYHLFYGDGRASPGSDLTFFDWPVGRERRGTHSIVRTGLRISGGDTLGWWADRLRASGIAVGDPAECDGRASLAFEDPEGQRLVLVDDGGAGESHPWRGSPVPPEHQVRGLGPITSACPARQDRAGADEILNMRKVREYAYPDAPGATVHVYAMGPGGTAAELHVAVEPTAPAASQGAGGVHHVAFRAPDRERLRRLDRAVEPNSGCHRAARWSATTSARSISASRTASCSRSRRTGPALPWTSLWRLGEKLSLPPFLEAAAADDRGSPQAAIGRPAGTALALESPPGRGGAGRWMDAAGQNSPPNRLGRRWPDAWRCRAGPRSAGGRTPPA